MDWKRKLTSRKLWAAIMSFAALLVVALGGTEAQATQITALIMAGATVISYIVGEGLVDAAAVGTQQNANSEPQADKIAAEMISAVQTETSPTDPTEPESGAVASDTTGAK